MSRITSSELYRYIDEGKFSLVRVGDIRNRRLPKLEWEFMTELPASPLICTNRKAANAETPNDAAYFEAHRVTVERCNTCGFYGLRRILFYNVSTTALFNRGSDAFDGKKPRRMMIVTKGAAKEIVKRMGIYDGETSPRYAWEIEKIYCADAENSVITSDMAGLPEGVSTCPKPLYEDMNK